MPSVPITFDIQETNAGVAQPVSNETLIMGVAQAGTDNAIVSAGTSTALVSSFTSGPLVQLGANYLTVAKRPQQFMRINDSVAGTLSAVTVVRVAASTGLITTGGSVPIDDYDVQVEILSSGATGTATFRHSLDGGDTFSGTLTVIASFVIPAVGITLTFTDGAGPVFWEDGDLHTFTTIGPTYVLADLQAALDAWIADGNIRVRRVHIMGISSTALHAGIITRMATAEAAFHFATALEESDDQGGGESVATWAASVLSDYSVENSRTNIVAGFIETAQVLDGLQSRRPIAWTVGPRMALIDISEDPGAVVDGPLQNAVRNATHPIPQDMRLVTSLENRGITTLQSYIGLSGAFCAGGFQRVQTTNSFYRTAHRQVMDAACDVAYDVLLPLINTNVAANADGTIQEVEAQSIEGDINTAIEANFVNVSPQRISPRDDGSYAVVDRTNNLVTSEQLNVTIRLGRRGFINNITVPISFST